MTDCLFCKIAKKEIPSGVVYEDDKVFAFNDIAPQAPTHILVIPKEHAANLSEIKDYSALADIFRVVNKLAVDRGIDKTGFRTVINTGRAAGMAVHHLHIHLLGGRDFSWPPG
ncbi:histidine triad nucleotide-binding protein [candidate division WOR-1 bacterium RIFCSPHIGHO2_01_FULL_53_15]|uniref:Histidine triad nucleotide-binding protein n=1 Tax=candidate division WOR-1 bacterium RIFCSPHIGHO2_01_FULL_53_15 TaxID=1802564 RepID=A0A1F4Q285_UNCSA|nr:MAG: histidine triad nucleotide-binding protein [candidate division WOR-1 bacterium RIFCSPHIGHO2_01_FULL_53_15]OGC13679.1 MAG: histidine triad nucleotide-binding protein [candidate division WOR-1 bacterium RIFCSPHIGHO2_02_FULL_53_26]